MQLKTFSIAALTFTALMPKISLGQEKQANVLFIITDQQRWDALDCAGNQ